MARARRVSSPVDRLPAPLRRWWLQWLNRRVPPAREVTLDQRKIFIFPTRTGFFYLLTMVAMFVGGINYENSLILNLCFLLTSLFIVTILHTYRNLSGLVLQAGRTSPAFAGEPAAIDIAMLRRGKRTYQAITLGWHQNTCEPQDLLEQEQVSVTLLLDTRQRGWLRPSRIRVESVFPLGLLRTWSWVDLALQVVVYPRPVSADLLTGDDHQPEGEGKRPARSGHEDFDQLRRYQPGESLQHVAWKQFAQGRGMFTKQFHGYQSDVQWLTWHSVPARDLETRLSQLTHWVLALSATHKPFGLEIPGQRIGPAIGLAHEKACLTALALYGLDGAPPAQEAVS